MMMMMMVVVSGHADADGQKECYGDGDGEGDVGAMDWLIDCWVGLILGRLTVRVGWLIALPIDRLTECLIDSLFSYYNRHL